MIESFDKFHTGRHTWAVLGSLWWSLVMWSLCSIITPSWPPLLICTSPLLVMTLYQITYLSAQSHFQRWISKLSSVYAGG